MERLHYATCPFKKVIPAQRWVLRVRYGGRVVGHSTFLTSFHWQHSDWSKATEIYWAWEVFNENRKKNSVCFLKIGHKNVGFSCYWSESREYTETYWSGGQNTIIPTIIVTAPPVFIKVTLRSNKSKFCFSDRDYQ